ncbi:MAG: type I-A CRISPR-associated protein Csa5 [Conexivisphaerales archaeon]
MSEDTATKRFKGFANLFALAAIASESYTPIDRLANALNPETVRQVLYEVCRNIDVMKRQNTVAVKEEQDNRGYTRLGVTIKQKERPSKTYYFYGLANDEICRNFLEEASSDLSVARRVGAYAMSVIATHRLKDE